ncbi:MAG TPA: glycosyltransferase family 1 protein [Deltaproteobacteria bacterium]|nr:glycosyltransferase family 1 protein [Deltaproteobacteria bacterium]
MASEKIRILRIISRMNVGGPAWQASVLTVGLNNDQFETRLICGEVDESELDFLELRYIVVPLKKLPTLGKPLNFWNDWLTFKELRKEIRDFRPHVVHTHTAKAGFLGRSAAFLEKVPIVVHTFHGHLLHGYFSSFKTLLFTITERFLARLSTALVSVGERVRNDLVNAKIGRIEQYVVVPPGVKLGAIPEQDRARKQLDISLETPVVLFVGRLTSVKRPDRLINSMFLLLESVPNAVLIIAGEGDLSLHTRELAKNLGDSVRFLGWQDDVERLYAAADIVVLCSDNEGMPVTLIEAASAGLPAVATDVGSTGEVVAHQKTGLLVGKSDTALAEGVRILLEDRDLLKSMGFAAKVRAEKHFGIEKLIFGYSELYKSLLAQLNVKDERA